MVRQLDYPAMKRIFTRFQAAEAEPLGELDHTNAFTLVVAVALSAQSTDVGVNKATKLLFQIADTPEKMLALGEAGVIEHIKTIGLFRNKAKNVIRLSEILVDKFDGQVPSSRAALQSLPGVGRKTANVMLSHQFGVPAIAVDTHVFRVANRTGLACGKTPDEVEQGLMKLIPRSDWSAAHHWLIWHGRKICRARSPLCRQCSLSQLCPSAEKVLEK